jgi:DNA-binding GntR family transcriptional regulator
MDPFAPEESQGIGDPVYLRVRERIRSDILSGRFQPGVRIKIADLARRYNVSQMPVREALQMLQGEGLVTIAPNRGASVRAVDERFIRNMYDVRAALEALLVRACARRISESDIFRLHSIEGHYEEAARGANRDACLRYNEQFHHVVYECADNPEALEMLERHWGLIDSLRGRYGFGPDRLNQIIAEHRQLLRALDQRDEKAAESLAVAHCEHAREDLLAQIRAERGGEQGPVKALR